MFRKTARIDVNIEESKDTKPSGVTQSVFTVNVKLLSGKFANYNKFYISLLIFLEFRN